MFFGFIGSIIFCLVFYVNLVQNLGFGGQINIGFNNFFNIFINGIGGKLVINNIVYRFVFFDIYVYIVRYFYVDDNISVGYY